MRNWTIKEAVEVIKAGNDQEAIKEIAKHFPMFFMAVATNDMVALTSAMGEKFTVRRLVFDTVVSEEAEEEKDAPVEEATEEAGETEDLAAMSTKALIALCGKRGIKVPKYGKNKQFYLDALQNANESAEETEEAVEEAEEDAYEGKSAMELYKLCKKRGIKVAPKKNAKFYADALRKADAEAAEAEDEADDWDDEETEEEAPAPTKKAAKGSKSTSKKASKAATKAAEAEAEDEDGDDWDI